MSVVRGWQLTVDWSGGGGLTGPLEDVTSYVNKTEITASWGRPVDGVSLAAPDAEMTFELRNRDRTWDRWFSPENTSSPIAGKIYPGREVVLTKTARGNRTFFSATWADAAAGVATWAGIAGTGAVSRVTTPTEDGNGALRFVPTGGFATANVAYNDYVLFATEPTGTQVISMRVYSNTALASLSAIADFYDQAGAGISASPVVGQAIPAGVWTTIESAPITVPFNAVSMRPRLRIDGTPPNTVQITIDSATVTNTPLDSGKTYVLFDGVLDDFGVDSQSPARTFSGKVRDGWSATDANLSTPLYTGIRTGTAIGLVLDAAGWTGPRAIDPGATVIPYWWEEGSSPAAAVDKLVNSEGWPAVAYVEGGTFVFRDRHHRIRSAASTTSQAMFSYIYPAGTGPGYDYKIVKNTFEYDHGLKSIYNSATFSVDQRKTTDIIEVWSSEDPIAMAAGETRTIFAQPEDPAFNVTAPTAEAGDIVAAVGTFTATVDRTSGQKFIIVITCVGSGTVDRLALRGNSLPVARTVQASASDAGSIGRYKESRWTEDVGWAGAYDAQAIADRIVAIYADNRPRISFTVFAFNDRHASRMLALRISDRITIRNDVLGVNGDFQVEKLEPSVKNWNMFQLKVSCVRADPVQPSNAFTFNVSGKGFDQGFFVNSGIDNPGSMFVFDQAGQGFDQGLFAT